MGVLLTRISLGLQMLSLPLLTPQVIGVGRMETIRKRPNALAKRIAKVALIVLVVSAVLAALLFGIPAFYASARHQSVATLSLHSVPGWLQEIFKIAIWGALVGGGGVVISVALLAVARLVYVATKKPEAFALFGGFVFALAVGLQLWATFYPT
jgi:hypothetical protein